jgi:superfamily II DNA/RNA helicase
LGEAQVGLVHGQLPPAQKDAAMADFASGRLRLLVATTVIEVGVNVPNASIMVIEGAQHFGLAQLHQLRGRVGRGAAQSTCVLVYDPPLGETARARLEILRDTEDGFRIAEEDLRLRGRGRRAGRAAVGPAEVPHRRPGEPGHADEDRPGRRPAAARARTGAGRGRGGRRSGCCSTCSNGRRRSGCFPWVDRASEVRQGASKFGQLMTV